MGRAGRRTSKESAPRTRSLRLDEAEQSRTASAQSGVAAAVLNHPAHGIAWLANKRHPHNASLHAGEIILSGSFTAPVPITRGDVFHADYGPLGSIAVRFV